MNLFHRHFGIVREIYRTPLRLILAFGFTIAIIELVIMFGIDYLPKEKGIHDALIDSVLLLLMASPVIYFLIFRPMVHFIASRKIAEEALVESEIHYRSLADSGQALIWKSGLDKKCYYFNQTWLNFTGRTLEQEMGDGWAEGVHPDDLQHCFNTYTLAFDRRDPFSMQYRMLHHSGEYRWIQDAGTPCYDSKGTFIGYIGHCLDITRLKQAEEKLKKSEETYRKIFEYSPIAAVFWNTDTRIIFWNKAAEATFGWTREEVIGRKFPEFFIPESNRQLVEASVELLIHNISNEVTTNENYTKDGSVIFCEWYNTILLDEQGKPATIISLAKDVTQQKSIEQELINAKEKAEESERLQASFLANMSHEIRTPLNSIIGFSELLADPVFDEEQKLEFARLINKGGNNLLEVITEIMDFSKLEAGKLKINRKSFLVSDLLKDLHKEYFYTAKDKEIQLLLEFSDEIKELSINSDEVKLRQVIINLLGNALKFTRTGSITLGANLKEDFVQFHVQDTGIGIPDEAKNMIFERFRQLESHMIRNHGGIGLGLAISKSLVELMGGTIWLESMVGKGTTFYFTIPLHQPADLPLTSL